MGVLIYGTKQHFWTFRHSAHLFLEFRYVETNLIFKTNPKSIKNITDILEFCYNQHTISNKRQTSQPGSQPARQREQPASKRALSHAGASSNSKIYIFRIDGEGEHQHRLQNIHSDASRHNPTRWPVRPRAIVTACVALRRRANILQSIFGVHPLRQTEK